MTTDANLPPLDLYERLARRLPESEHRALLRALLDRLAAGGSEAVREEVRRRLQEVVRDAS